QAHHLVVTLAPTEFHGATYEGNVVEIGARGEIARELPKRMLEAEAHLPCPCNRCALLRHRWNLLVPQMQIDEAVADVARRAIRKHEVPVQTAEFDTQNTSGVMGVFDDGLPAAQYAVQPKDELVQPKMTLSPHRRPDQSPLPRFSHGIGCLTARLLQYYRVRPLPHQRRRRGVSPRDRPRARADRRSTRARFPQSPPNRIPEDRRDRTCRARRTHSAPP